MLTPPQTSMEMVLTLVLLFCTLSPGLSGVIPLSHQTLSSFLYGSVTLPCHVSFVRGVKDLTFIWTKIDNKESMCLYKFLSGKENLQEQDPRCRGRVEISSELSQGNLDLTLRNVTYKDEGTYYCRAANSKSHGDVMVTLTIEDLNAKHPTITLLTKKRHLKCLATGVFHAPQIEWITLLGEDLSGYGSLNVTDLGDGQKKVESVLDYGIKENEQVLCHVREGRLKRSTRVVISDGTHPIAVEDL